MSHFIVLEGLEGAGKTTAIESIQDFLKQRLGEAQEIVLTREPGGTPLAEKLRHIIKSTQTEAVCPLTELLLICAARLQLVEHVIRPALTRGAWVIGDRHSLSTLAYQGGGRQIPLETITSLQKQIMPDFTPTLTLYLDLDPKIGLERIRSRQNLDRIEQETLDFFQRTRSVYLDACQNQKNVVCVDASREMVQVHQAIQTCLEERLCFLG